MSSLSQIAAAPVAGDGVTGTYSSAYSPKPGAAAFPEAAASLLFVYPEIALAVLKNHVKRVGGIAKLARAIRIHERTISAIVNGRKPLGNHVASKIGLRVPEKRGGLRPSNFGRAK